MLRKGVGNQVGKSIKINQNYLKRYNELNRNSNTSAELDGDNMQV